MPDGENGPGLRHRILDAARQLFVQEGFAQVSMRGIARIIGHSPTAIYRHFQGKAEILTHLVEDAAALFLDALRRAAGQGAGPDEALGLALEAYVDTGLAHPNSYRVLFMLPADIWPRPEDHLPEGSRAGELYAFVRGLCAARLERRRGGPVPEAEAAVDSHVLWANAHGLVSLLLTYPTFPWGPLPEIKKRLLASALAA